MSGIGSQSDWVSTALTAFGMIVGVGIVLLQLGRQHRSSLKLQRGSAREALRLKVYESLGAKARAFAEAESEARSYVESIVREMQSSIWAATGGFPQQPSTLRATELARRHFAASSALVELITEIESWEIAFPAAELFRTAFSSVSYDIDQVFHPLYQSAVHLFPGDMPDGRLFVPPLPSAEMLGEIKEKVAAYTEARADLRNYTHDLIVEAQNLLLSKLFKRRVAIRKPIDPACKVITAENSTALMQYFKTETPAGKAWAEASEQVHSYLISQGKQPIR